MSFRYSMFATDDTYDRFAIVRYSDSRLEVFVEEKDAAETLGARFAKWDYGYIGSEYKLAEFTREQARAFIGVKNGELQKAA